MKTSWPWNVKQAPTYTAGGIGDRRGLGLCEQCSEYAVVVLNGHLWLCWDHYAEMMRVERAVRADGQSEDKT